MSIVTGGRISRKFKNKMKKMFIGYDSSRVSKDIRLGWLKADHLIDITKNKSFRIVCLK